MVISLEGKKLELTYPCNWDYKIIINSHCNINHIIKNVIGDRDYKISKANNSKNRTYQSYRMTLLVHNEDDRVELYSSLKREDCVKIVL